MFRSLKLATTALMIFLFSGFSLSAETITFYSWDDYIDPVLIDAFETETGIRVVFEAFDDDDERDLNLSLTKGEGYDLILVDNTFLELDLAREVLAQVNTLDYPELREVYHPVTNRPLEDREYAIPYFWGTTGIGFRTDLMETPESWMDIFTPRTDLAGRILMPGSNQDIISAALKALGYSANDFERNSLREAQKLLIDQAPNVLAYRQEALDESHSLVTGVAMAAVSFNGDVLLLQEENDAIDFVVPQEGGFLWIDYLAVSARSSRQEIARRFIAFLNRPENARINAEYNYYAVPNRAAEALLEEDMASDPLIYPPASVLAASELQKEPDPRSYRQISNIITGLGVK